MLSLAKLMQPKIQHYKSLNWIYYKCIFDLAGKKINGVIGCCVLYTSCKAHVVHVE